MQEFFITMDIMLPLLLMLAVGWFLARIGLIREPVTAKMNQLVFRVFLPVLLFNNIRTLDISEAPGIGFAAYTMLGVLFIFLLAQWIVPRFEHDPRKIGVMVQGIFRSNFAILGVALMSSLFPETGLAAVTLALPLVVPLNHILAVIALSSGDGKTKPLALLKSVVTNPLIIAAALGAVFLFLRIPLPSALNNVCGQLANLASPVSLLVLGASLKWQGVKDNKNQLIWTVLLKQLVIPFVMVGLAVLLGFHHEELAVMIILFGAPAAVSSYPMAQAMGKDGTLAASQLVLTTIFSMGTLFALIYAGKLLGVL